MTHLAAFSAALSFPLDDFQIEGCQAVEAGHGVLVCAPTGAGKTIVGEFAVSLALSQGLKCFYTTPIKALSNQKFHDLQKVHGEDAVGLLTGDVSINGGAEIVVMTTEVLRNMIYTESTNLERLAFVVMDEIHFLADQSRGAVWEEVILNLDESVQIIGLSATVSNSEEFGNWMSTVRGDTKVVVTDKRPVPLDQYMLVGRKIFPLFENADGKVNRELEEYIRRLESGQAQSRSSEYNKAAGFRSRSKRGEVSERLSQRSGKPRESDRFRPLGRPEVLQILRNQKMLPAITFIFSRAGCDGALYQCMRSQLTLTTQEEAELIAEIVDKGVEGIPEEDLAILDFKRWKQALMRGFAAHHAGMLPAFRHVVEELFVKGLVRAVFATETLAMGINMPARSVVLEKLVKFNGEAHVDLTPGQYTQLTGRAGRRGIDVLGNAVVQWAPAMDPRAVAGLASTRTYPLISTFAPGYNMSVNLLKTIGYEPAHRLLEKSFAQYQADGSVVDEVRELERAEEKVEQLRRELSDAIASFNPPATSGDPIAEFMEYMQIRRELKDAERKAKRHNLEERFTEVTRVLAKLQNGQVIAMPGRKHPLLAVVVSAANNAKDPKPWVIMETGWSGRIDVESFAIPPIVIGQMRLSKDVTHHPKRHARYVVEQFKRNHYPRPKNMRLESRTRGNDETAQLRVQLREHPVHKWSDLEQLARIGERLTRRQRDLDRLDGQVSAATDTLGRTFDRILALLEEMSYVEFAFEEDGTRTPIITDEGERLAQIHGEADLLVAQCLRRGVWNELDPAELAGVVSMCVFENRKETQGEAEAATDAMADAMNATLSIWTELEADERRHRLPVTKMPEAGFSLAVHQWAAGAPLDYCMQAAAASGAELTPGDFVRWCRQVIDALEQVKKTGYTDDIKRNARKAVEAIRRGVVAIGS
ncbi:ski2-like helicase [Corynebacterium kalinowskii]|uniref:Ski2-like helicase n=1 Tax=Corynebacterium kalinowskii TaxID=2675216 RepID=A0A6B8VQ89_9CORY|nr:RNA helicase [Corynebacterium kalinowskii]QGU01991.1 ski2-like helicase [Corynebacterium kalinowskii]